MFAEMISHLRRAIPKDLEGLWQLELACFEPGRLETRRTLQRSLKNPKHEVWLCAHPIETAQATAALYLRVYRKTVRLHSIAVHPSAQGQGLGSLLFDHARKRTQTLGRSYLSLEAEQRNTRLCSWYARHGFRVHRELPNYYAPDRPALRMRLTLDKRPDCCP